MKTIILISLFLFSYTHIKAKPDTLHWEYMGSPGRGNCNNFKIGSKGIMYFSGNTTLEKSTDGGVTWKTILYHSNNYNFLQIDSKTIFLLLIFKMAMLLSIQ
jgi:hypothetical protein